MRTELKALLRKDARGVQVVHRAGIRSASGMQYKAEILLDADTKILAGGVYDKPRFYPPTGGSSTLNSTVDRPDILDLGSRFLQGIGWYGMGDCDFILDPRDNTPEADGSESALHPEHQDPGRGGSGVSVSALSVGAWVACPAAV